MLIKAPISLDYTLQDQYAQDNDGKSPPDLFYYPFGFHVDGGLPSRFIYNSGLESEKITADTSAQLTLMVRGISQRYGFSAGRLNMIFPTFTPGEEEKSPNQIEIERTFSQLRHDQQPKLSFVTGPDSITLGSDTGIAVLVPSDSMLNVPHIVDPDIHYELLSKRGLAVSGIPTPPSVVIDPKIAPDDVKDPNLRQQAIDQMLDPIDTYQIPFVVKLNQSVSSKGVFIATSEAHRAQIKQILTVQLQDMLMEINAINNHLYPSSIILQDYISSTAVGLSMFVTKSGRALFNACCQQIFDKGGHWIGGQVSYPDQEALKKTYTGIMNQIAQFLHQKGYYGPAGADVLTSETGQHYVVDLNIRVTGSHNLGPLTGHFTQRGLTNAAIITEYFTYSRSDFETTFKTEITDGAVIICSWVRDEAIKLSHGAILMGGADAVKLGELIARVLKLASA
ncbi:solid-state culture specific atp-grasp domain [Trichoderma arundinaceum]|uniref:Solid-state culture specific atp-grasp domain n=1 Tax=Trichoderma arundinaceum TaxID=490622 RepID=A0A395NK41_TRIAR|nr:solid-state culture specific atp-grasp domain [Trichoderma arundinaceum]